MPRVSDEHRAARREQILTAAIRCAAREGFHKTTMAHVIDESGLSAGAVYGYFKGKPDLIRAIAERAVGRLADTLDAIASGEQPVTVLGALADVLAELDRMAGAAESPFPAVAVHAWSEAARDEQVREVVGASIDRVHRAWVGVLERATTDGDLPEDADRDALARAMLGLLPGYVLQGLLLDRVGADAYVRGVAQLLDVHAAR